MAGLGNTVARLLKQQGSWKDGLPSGFGDGALPPIRGKGLLEEVEDDATNPGNLRMLRYRPAQAQNSTPLVVVLHGCTQHAADYANGAGWIELADRYGFCLLLPEQRRGNNPNLCFNWFVPSDTTRGSGEVLSIRQMIARTVADWSIDQAKIFVTGLSAGGAMTSAMLATYPEIFAGGAIIAGLPYQSADDIPGAFRVMAEGRTMTAEDWGEAVRSASPHRGPWPKVSIWQGSADQTVNPRNSTEIAKQWTAIHETGRRPDREEKQQGHLHRIWNNPSGEPVVEEYIVAGLGHGTPLATGTGAEHFGAPAPYLLDIGLSSSYRIVQFWGIAKGLPAGEVKPHQESTMAPSVTTPKPTHIGVIPRASQPRPAPPRPSSRHDIGAIINKALKSAGLLK